MRNVNVSMSFINNKYYSCFINNLLLYLNKKLWEHQEKKALELLKEDLSTAVGCVNRIVNQWVKDERPGAKMDMCMYEAIVSLVFNSGCENVRTSPWIQDVKFGRWDEATKSIKTWNPPQQRTQSGKWIKNYTRREKESNLFSSC